MTYATNSSALVFLLLTFGVGGCAAPGLSLQSFSVRRVKVATADAHHAAEQVLVERGFVIARSDRITGVVSSYPRLIRRGDADGTRRARLGTPRHSRRVVEIRVSESSDGVGVYCKVAIEEQVTNDYRFRALDLNTSDTPGATPIEREAGTTREQNAVWRTVRHDKRLEQSILSDILARTERSDGQAPADEGGARQNSTSSDNSSE